MTKREDVTVGLDLGTSSLKGVVLDVQGREVATAQSGYETSRPSPGRSEQSPAEWVRALEEVLRELASAVPVARWSGIGLTGMLPTLVTVDGAGNPTGPAITWEDTRAEAEGEAIRQAVGVDALYQTTGQRVDGRYLLPMLQWLRRCEPQRVQSTRSILGARDYLFLWLTGEIATDPSTAAGYGCFDLHLEDWDAEIARCAGAALPNEPIVDAGRPGLPPIRAPRHRAPLTQEAAAVLGLPSGLPIFLGAADSVTGALGLGASEPGQVAYNFGTSTVIMAISERPLLDRAHRSLVTPLIVPERWGLELDLVSTGSAVGWLADTLGLAPAGQVFELASKVEPGAHGLTFLPYLGGGEQGALWNPDLRGALLGLTLSHTPADIARALLDGILVETARCVRVLDETDLPRREILVAAHDPPFSFLQDLADATGRAVVLPPSSHSVSARGAARLAASTEAPSNISMRDVRCIQHFPRPERKSMWDDLLDRNTQLLQSTCR